MINKDEFKFAEGNQILRIKKLSGKGIIRTAGRHNLREIQAELGADSHIDATRTHLNIVLAGSMTASAISDDADALMLAAGFGKLKKNAVRGLEILVSLPPAIPIDQQAFFSQALDWAKGFYGLPVLSAVIHRDEAAPHLHIIMLPLINGRMQGSDLVGYKTRLQATQASFYNQVGRRHGLARPKPKQRLSAATRAKSASLVMTTLQSNPELLDRPDIAQVMQEIIGRDPETMLSVLGLSVPHPPKRTKSFVEIMTQPVKPEKPIEFRHRSNPIRFAHRCSETDQTLSCVGFDEEAPSIIAAKTVESANEDAPLPDNTHHRRQTDEKQTSVVYSDAIS